MPIAPGEFAAAITPCLTLVGGIGMGQKDRTEWMHAAWLVLNDVPVDLLRIGIKAAMTKAGHPSKIVAAIMDEVRSAWDARRATIASGERRAAALRAQIAETEAYRQRIEGTKEPTGEILARVWPTMHKHEPGYQSGEGKLNLDPNRECRKPTRADYIAMGVAPEALDAMDMQ